MKDLVLASQSPRRQELLGRLGLPFLIAPAQGEEHIDPSKTPSALVESLAEQKASEILASHPNALVIGADTLVVLGEEVLGKPRDLDHAFAMVQALQGNTHRVFTGVCLKTSEKTMIFHEETQVSMCALNETQIRHYLAQGESMDKAGAYGIQGIGACFIQGIVGDYFNVMGLPLCRVTQAMGEFGLGIFAQEGEDN